MKILFADCVSGMAGDMMLSALIDLGVSLEVVVDAVERVVPSEVTFSLETVTSGGIRAIRTTVRLAGATPQLRHYTDIVSAIEAAGLAPGVTGRALAVFKALAEAEAAVHGVAVEDVHFHEVGAWDSIADIVGVAAALEALDVADLESSPVPLGSGTVATEHGLLPVPAPATLELLKGVPVVRGAGEGELTTPTGAALLRVFAGRFGSMPDMVVRKVGYGAGHRDLPGRPNVVRLVLGEVVRTDRGQDGTEDGGEAGTVLGEGENGDAGGGREWLVATNLDDCSPQVVAHATDKLFAAGALDVWCTPIHMKKNRSGVELSLICRDEERSQLRRILFRETTAIGLREVPLVRTRLPRELLWVTTPFGRVRIKVCRLDGAIVNAAPEFEDARRLAEEHGVPVREVLAAAVEACRCGFPDSESIR